MRRPLGAVHGRVELMAGGVGLGDGLFVQRTGTEAGKWRAGLRVGVDYLWGLAQLLSDRSALDLDFYIGAGPFVGSLRGPCGGWEWGTTCNGDLYLGGRVPIGLEAVFKRAPVAVGLELAPGLAFSAGRSGFLLDTVLTLRVLL